jgi:hypothetical protein
MSIKSKIIKLVKLGPIDVTKILFHSFFFGKGFAFFEKLGLHVLPVHFYSPVGLLPNNWSSHCERITDNRGIF